MVTSHRYVCICRFQRVLIERTHAATLSCTLGEQYPRLHRGKKHKSTIKYPRTNSRANVEISSLGNTKHFFYWDSDLHWKICKRCILKAIKRLRFAEIYIKIGINGVFDTEILILNV